MSHFVSLCPTGAASRPTNSRPCDAHSAGSKGSLTLEKLRSSVRSCFNPWRCFRPASVTSVPLRPSHWSCRNPWRCSKPASVT